MDCSQSHLLCKEDDSGRSSCESPEIGDDCFNEGFLHCTADSKVAVCEDLEVKEVELQCLGGEKCSMYAATGLKNTLACGSGDNYRDYSLEGTPCGTDFESKMSEPGT